MGVLKELELQIDGFIKEIGDYTKDMVYNDICKLKGCLMANDIESVKILIKIVIEWFEENRDKILTNENCFHKGTLMKIEKKFKNYDTRLESYEERIENKVAGTDHFKNKIFISHSSKDENVVRQLEVYLRGLGISQDLIFCSSIEGQGVKNGEKIESAIRNAMEESKLFLYVISNNFIKSNFCQQELGAGWILNSRNEVELFLIKLDDVNLNEENGFINSNHIYTELNDDSLDIFSDDLRELFKLGNVKATENKKLKKALLSAIGIVGVGSNAHAEKISNILVADKKNNNITTTNHTATIKDDKDNISLLSKFSELELLLFNYMVETDKYNLYAGWQAQKELDMIKAWCEINNLNLRIRDSYENLLNKYQMRKVIKVSSTTSYGNPKEYILTDEYIDLFDNLTDKDEQLLGNNKKKFIKQKDDLPF